jgi:Glycogen debranching enzyme
MDHFKRYESLIRSYVLQNAGQTLKPANAYLRYPFIDPGSVYDGNLWDWDSFWAAYALFDITGADNGQLPAEKVLECARGNILNFFDNQLDDGYIPMMIEKTDLPEPYLNLQHKQGVRMNMLKPFLCRQIALISGVQGDYAWISPYIDRLELYFTCYDKGYYNGSCGLYVFANDIMIGVDNDPATFGKPADSSASIYLNTFMVLELKAMAKILKACGRETRAGDYLKKADELSAAIQRECWDPRDQFFYTVDVDIKTRAYDWFHKGLGVFWKTLPIKIRVWSGFLPLYAGIATREQAEALVRHLNDPQTFCGDYGIRSLARDEKMYNLEATNNPSNWLGPLWIIVQYIVYRGLVNYGYDDEAKKIAEKTILLLGGDIEKTGTLHEYYVPETGEPVMNGGFLNWNLLVVNMLDELAGKPSIERFLL